MIDDRAYTGCGAPDHPDYVVPLDEMAALLTLLIEGDALQPPHGVTELLNSAT
jgi:hypothetical protein